VKRDRRREGGHALTHARSQCARGRPKGTEFAFGPELSESVGCRDPPALPMMRSPRSLRSACGLLCIASIALLPARKIGGSRFWISKVSYQTAVSSFRALISGFPVCPTAGTLQPTRYSRHATAGTLQPLRPFGHSSVVAPPPPPRCTAPCPDVRIGAVFAECTSKPKLL
jgi:hypothetical protein